MIRFDFTVSDEDAQLLFDAIDVAIEMAETRARNGDFSESERDWVQNHAQYLRDLKAKMHNGKAS